MATRTAPITRQFAVTGTPVHLGDKITEEGKFRVSIPSGSSVWIGKKDVPFSGDDGGGEYRGGTAVQLPSTSMQGWYAVTNGASVTITLECATGGADAPDWADAGTVSASGGGGGGGTVDQGTGDALSPWYVQGVNSGTPERLATAALQGAGLPNALTGGGGVKVGLVDQLPTGTNVVGKVEMAANAQADGHSATIGATTDADTTTTLVGLLKWIKARLPTALVGNRLDTNVGSWFGATTPTVGQKTATASIPIVWASDAGLPTGTNWVGKVRIGDGTNEPVFVNSAPVGTEYGMGVRVISMPNVTATVSGVAQDTTLSTFSGKFTSAVQLFSGVARPTTTQTWAWSVLTNPGAWGGADTGVLWPGNGFGAAVQGFYTTGTVIGTIRPLPLFVDSSDRQRFGRTDDSGRLIVQPFDGVANTTANRGLPVRMERPARDAYNRARTVSPHEVMGASFLYSAAQNDVGTELATGGAVTWNSTDQALSLDITGTSGSLARIGSHRSTLANRGRSGGPTFHFKFGTSNANNRYDAYIASTDGAYGFGVREQGGAISIVIYHPGAGGEVLIPSAAWNINTAAAIGLTTLNTTFHTVEGQGAGDGGFFTRISIDGEPVHFLGPIPSALAFPSFAWRIQARALNTAAGVAGSLRLKSFNFSAESGTDDGSALYPDAYTLAADKTATTTEAVAFAIRPTLTVSGKDNPLPVFPVELVPVFDTGNVEFRAYYQRGGTDPTGGTGTWVASATGPWDVNATISSFTPNANTILVGFTSTVRGGDKIDFSKSFGDGSLLALRSRFNDANREMLIVTIKTRSGSHPANVLLKFDHQANL